MTTVREIDLINNITAKHVEDGMPAWEARLQAKRDVCLLEDQREIVPTCIMWSPFSRRDYVGAVLA